MARATPKARARRHEQGKVRLEAAPYQKQPDEKPPLSCAICWEEFWKESTDAKYAFIPGANKECRLGHSKGTCYLASQANTDTKWQEVLDWRQSQTGVEPKPRRAKAAGRKKQQGGDTGKDAEIRRLKKMVG